MRWLPGPFTANSRLCRCLRLADWKLGTGCFRLSHRWSGAALSGRGSLRVGARRSGRARRLDRSAPRGPCPGPGPDQDRQPVWNHATRVDSLNSGLAGDLDQPGQRRTQRPSRPLERQGCCSGWHSWRWLADPLDLHRDHTRFLSLERRIAANKWFKLEARGRVMRQTNEVAPNDWCSNGLVD